MASLVTALGALIVFIKPEYERAGVIDEHMSSLLMYPNLLLGVGDLALDLDKTRQHIW